ncbi:arsenate reductase (glutaredoxin) [bacterium]|nr:arsenate reductase (glutaredoxin) [bacterium]
MNVTIYHNPRCTKSRQTLSRLQEKGIEPEVIRYLDTPPDEKTLKQLLKKLGLKAQQLVRKKDYQSLGLTEPKTESEWIAQMAANPKIIERPIVVVGNQARLGRPPEAIDEILP